jgi:hypothetical protein
VTQAYPLYWPLGFPRTKFPSRSQFRTSLDMAQQNVTKALRSFAKDSGKDIVNLTVSSNVTMMTTEPKDGGVAVYFRWDNIDCCIAVDRYPTPAENLQAIMHVIEAERTKLRHGGLNITRAGFRGYAALPPPKGPDGQLEKPWWHVLGFTEAVPIEAAEAKYREMVKTHHPDRGGDAAAFNLVTDAIRRAREEKRA